jgi:hypothetical protein
MPSALQSGVGLVFVSSLLYGERQIAREIAILELAEILCPFDTAGRGCGGGPAATDEDGDEHREDPNNAPNSDRMGHGVLVGGIRQAGSNIVDQLEYSLQAGSPTRGQWASLGEPGRGLHPDHRLFG